MKCCGNDKVNPSRDNFTLKHYCIICNILLMDNNRVMEDHYLTEFHHFSHELHPGHRNKDENNRTAEGYSEAPRVALSKIPIMSSLFFCIPCGNKVLYPIAIGKNHCATCVQEVDLTTDHTTGTVLKKLKNGFNIHAPIAWHHDCLPSVFDDVKTYAKERRVRMASGKKQRLNR